MRELFQYFMSFITTTLTSTLKPEDQIWYETIKKPFWILPKWIFSPVWSILYTMIGMAAVRIFFCLPKSKRLNAIRKAFLIQILANLLWSPLFFGMHNITLSLFDMVILWTANAYTLLLLRDEDLLTAFLLLPYQIWITFALSIEMAIFWMN